jgi:bifunctional DNA-binding transcriptional regulator/antitoxin component of YhaV-PrlF toxin-antitoxin module
MVTIPAQIRKALGIATPGQVEFVVRDDGVVELRAPAFTLDDVFGSVPPCQASHLTWCGKSTRGLRQTT